MNASAPEPSAEDVLSAFAVEEDYGRETLERYLRLYPAMARQLIDLARELEREIVPDDSPLSAEELTAVDAAWAHHVSQKAAGVAVEDPLGALDLEQLRNVAKQLDLPRQVLTAFRERRVPLASVPARFLERLAQMIHTSVERLRSAWELPPAPLARSFKSEFKPEVGQSVSFEQVLLDAGLPKDRVERLISGEE